MDVIIDGTRVDSESASLSVWDEGLLRGDGCFETLKAYGGRLFARDEHVDRLAVSASALKLPVPARSDVASWLDELAADVGTGYVRIILTRGREGRGGRTIVMGGEVDPPSTITLLPVIAPWHGAGVAWELAGAKTLSYAPNRSATRAAQEAGHDDAVLLSRDGFVLEGPTFAVAWLIDGVLETPGLELGILDSITRRTVFAAADDLGWATVEKTTGLDRLYEADEVVALSTIKEVTGVAAIGDRRVGSGEQASELQSAFLERVHAALG